MLIALINFNFIYLFIAFYYEYLCWGLLIKTGYPPSYDIEMKIQISVSL